MKHSRKYDTSALVEAQYEPGSRGRVLKNKLGIKRRREMDRVEIDALARSMVKLAGMFAQAHRFKAKDICLIHKIWLGDIYEWAARLLADLMAMQANYSPLDYTGISKGKQRKAYFRAVQEGMDKNYRPMIEIFGRVISRTLKEVQQ